MLCHFLAFALPTRHDRIRNGCPQCAELCRVVVIVPNLGGWLGYLIRRRMFADLDRSSGTNAHSLTRLVLTVL